MKSRKKDYINPSLLNRLKAHGVKEIDRSLTLAKVYHHYHGICQECRCHTALGKWPQVKNSATMEHVIPISQGGNHTWENVQLLCYACNGKRNNRNQIVNMTKPSKVIKAFGYEIIIRKAAA